jgi:hypothetical protein
MGNFFRRSVLSTSLLVGCSADEQQDEHDVDTNQLTTDSETTSGMLTGGSSEETTDAPFDASRWIGRYHYETPFLPFGERGDPMGPYMLANFEIFADSTAIMLFDQ